MDSFIYKIELFSDWHTGSGLSAGADIDLLVIKDRINLPFIPGKTLKGLLKDAAIDLWEANAIDEQAIVEIFGKEAKRKDKSLSIEESAPSIEGSVHFSNAELTKILKENLKTKAGHLYRKISSTAIQKDGMAKEHSLRRIEVTIPLVLFAKIENISKDSHYDLLKKCMKMVKRLGTGRNRGFGRCELAIIEGGN